MSVFPFQPFLQDLRREGFQIGISDYGRIAVALRSGGPWDMGRVRDVLMALLAKDPDQQDLFLRKFAAFFPAGDGAALSDAEIETVLENLQVLAERPGRRDERRPRKRRISWAAGEKETKKPFPWAAVFMTVLVIGFFIWWHGPWRQDQTPIENTVADIPEPPAAVKPEPEAPKPETKPEPEPPPEPKRIYENTRYIKEVQAVPMVKDRRWLAYVLASAYAVLILLCYTLYLKERRKVPTDKPAEYDPKKPRHFSTKTIGGRRVPVLDDDTLDHLADAMGYFQTEHASREVDAPASVKATVQAGGVPDIRFLKRKQVRALVVLEDACAEAGAWNPIAGELAAGMVRRGVPVIHGVFSGAPEQFKTGDGAVLALEDLEDRRRGCLVLIFTDGKGVKACERSFVLEHLSRWPMVAWMELREERFWDDTVNLPLSYGIPVFPATPEGLLTATGRFLTEQGTGKDAPGKDRRPARLSETPGRTDAQVERILGDALLWAQDCAMAQPVSPGLADALRREFHPGLPSGRMGRLFALPGTVMTASGIQFSDEVQQVLEKGFRVRRSRQAQADVLRFVLKELDRAAPAAEDGEKPGLCRLKWEMMREFIRMELEEDYDGQRLSELGLTDALGPAVSERFDRYDVKEDGGRRVVRSKNPVFLQRLARLKLEHLNIPELKDFPLRPMQLMIVAGLLIAALAFGAIGGMGAKEAAQATKNWEMVGPQGSFMALEVQENGGWIVEHKWMDNPPNINLEPDRTYRATLYDNGYRSRKTFTAEKDVKHRIIFTEGRLERNCTEDVSDIGLTVQYCADGAADIDAGKIKQMWTPVSEEIPAALRQTVVGLEASDGAAGDGDMKQIRNALLAGKYLERLYRVEPDGSGAWHVSESMDYIKEDALPWLANSALIWWRAGTPPETLSEKAFPEFGVVVNMDREKDVLLAALKQPETPEPEPAPAAPEQVEPTAPAPAPPEPEKTLIMFTLRSNEHDDEAFIDGKPYGPTRVDVELAPGPHSVRVEKPGFKTFEQDVNLQEPVTLWAKLEPAAVLRVETDPPGATVYVDGKEQGVSPLTVLGLAPGNVQVQAVLTGYDAQEKSVEVLPENPEPVVFTLEKSPEKKGSLFITTSPPDAEIRIVSTNQDYTEGMALAAGSYDLEITKESYKTERRTIQIAPGEATQVKVALEQKPVVTAGGDLEKKLSMEFVYIKPGTFMMGSPKDEPGRDSDETQHQVTLTKGFYMQTTEVTQGQWEKVMGNNPSSFKECGKNCPVEQVSWNDVQGFIEKLNQMAGKKIYRLPTEAEWEYACRAGSKTALYTGPIKILGDNNAPALDPVAWYGGNSCVDYKGGYGCSGWSDKQYQCDNCGTHPIRQKKPNQWGLFDMLGNVWEWCQDWKGNYPSSQVTDPVGPQTGSGRVIRGGGWFDFAQYCRSAGRDGWSPDYRFRDLGFRLVREAP